MDKISRQLFLNKTMRASIFLPKFAMQAMPVDTKVPNHSGKETLEPPPVHARKRSGHVLFDPRSLPRVGLPRRWRDTSVLSPASPSACLPLSEFRRTELLDIMGLAHLFNISIKLYGPYMCINGFIPYGNLIERRLYLNTWSLADLFEK